MVQLQHQPTHKIQNLTIIRRIGNAMVLNSDQLNATTSVQQRMNSICVAKGITNKLFGELVQHITVQWSFGPNQIERIVELNK